MCHIALSGELSHVFFFLEKQKTENLHELTTISSGLPSLAFFRER